MKNTTTTIQEKMGNAAVKQAIGITPAPYPILALGLFCFMSFFAQSCASLLGGMGGDQGSWDDGQAPVYDEMTNPVSFTILQMNDVYEIAPLEKGTVGGMARVATIRNRLLEENYNLLTVLAGDFVSPSLLGTLKYEGRPIKGRQMVETMNALGVNLVAFGNHEFDIKEQELQERLNESYFEWLGTNVLHQTGKKLEPFYKESYGYKYYLPETYVWEVFDYMSGKPIKVGFYSALLNDNQADYVYYEDPYQEATKAYLELMNSCDVVIGLTHLELNQDMKLAALLPKTKLIMGGHEHENSLDTIGNVVITKADANAKTVWVHRFTYFPETKTTSLESELVPINNDIADDSTVEGIVDKWQQIQRESISQLFDNPDEVIYTANVPLDGREKSVRNFQTNLGGLISASMAAAASKPVDAAFFNGGSIRLDDQLLGNITAVDIFRALPFGGPLYEVELKGSVLKKALEAGLENKGIGGYLQWHNIEYIEAAKTWKIGGKPLNEGKVYRIMTNEYLFLGKEARLDFFNQKNFVKWETARKGDTNDLRGDVRKAVVAYLKVK
ncbi:MAG: bifunctional metallophosphatase/5'-nucleotidase [Lewinellaceae bacterium]|nr:bifunctional metallophosphatase/5'-nucleotidase [Saprospiraceae bacterium]MCB9340922.1 bifunctional metallophosphatase/5'-nucleotidase [Lewinellaceae bacterium]